MKNLLLSIFVLAAMTIFSFAPLVSAESAAKTQIKCGADTAAGVDCGSSASQGSVTNLVTTVINVLSALAGAAAVVMLIYGGFRYVTSAGNDTAVATAKKTITYALIGLIIVAFAQVIVHFVLNNVGTDPGTSSSQNSGKCLNGQPVC